MSDLEDLYRQELMEHYAHPHNFGQLKTADISYHDSNPVCGDEITLQLQVNNGTITKAMFTGNGCAISQAAASILTENLAAKNIKEVAIMTPEDMLKLLRINPGPVRIKCALLAMRAAQKGIVHYEAAK